MTKRVAILTGGGEVPGLNMCVKSLVYQVIDAGFEPVGVRKGWDGLIQYNPQDPTTYSDNFIELTKNMVRPIDRTPGSYLHSSRQDPRAVPASSAPEFLRTPGDEVQDLSGHIQKVVERLGYQALIVIGDDDTLHYAAQLSRSGVPVIAIPKTIHNNIQGTDYTLGFSTGLSRGVAFIHELRALAGSREQILVIETFAAKSGYSTLLMAFLAGVDRTIIPEVPYDPQRLARLILGDQRQNPSNYAVVTITDGARLQEGLAAQLAGLPAAGERRSAGRDQAGPGRSPGEQELYGSGMVLAEALRQITGEEVFLQPLTYLLRTGPPDGQDLLGAANFAFTAAHLLGQGTYGRMAAFTREALWTHVDLDLAAQGVKTVDVETWYDSENYKPRLSLIWSLDKM